MIVIMQFDKVNKKTGHNVRLTPSEAGWIAGNLAVGETQHLARRVEQSRREAVRQYLPAGIFKDVVVLPSDWMTVSNAEMRRARMQRYLAAEHAMVTAEETHSVSDDGAEQNTVPVVLSERDTATLRCTAEEGNQAARERMFGERVSRAEAAELLEAMNALSFRDLPNGPDMASLQITENILHTIEEAQA